jgi:hypothetical protein
MSARWLILLAFIVPFLDADYALKADSTVFALNLISLLACALLLSGLNAPLKRTLWAWAFLSVFIVGYYGKTYLIATPGIHDKYLPDFRVASELTMVDAYYYFSLSFIVVCVTSWVCLAVGNLRLRQETYGTPQIGRLAVPRTRLISLITTAAILSVIVNAIVWQTGMGVMGRTWVRWPFLLDSLALRLKSDFIPAVLLLAAWAAGRTGRKTTAVVAAAFFILHSTVASLISASRGGISTAALVLALLWGINKSLTRRQLGLITCLLVASMVLYPYITGLRQLWGGQRYSRAEAMTAAVDSYRGASALDTVTFGAMAQFARISGADSVWMALQDVPRAPSVERFRQLFITDDLPTYVTRELYGINAAADFRAPSLVGAFLLIGGPIGLLVLSFAYPASIYLLWNAVSRLACGPACLAWFGLFILNQTSEGTFRPSSWFTFGLTVVVCEFLARRWLRIPNGFGLSEAR